MFGQRAAALAALIRQDPGAALAIAFSQELLDALAADFPGSAQDLEQHGTWSGTSDHLIFDDPDSQSADSRSGFAPALTLQTFTPPAVNRTACRVRL